MHYAVAYNIASEKGRVDQVKYAFSHIGPAVTLAALTTFIAGKQWSIVNLMVVCMFKKMELQWRAEQFSSGGGGGGGGGGEDS